MINIKKHIETLSEFEEHAMESLRGFFDRLSDIEKSFHNENSFEISSVLVDKLFHDIEMVKYFFDLHAQYLLLVREVMTDEK